ncbi:hypothetical protein E2C01_030798 [Portunus trituberculatus]|uniref:Uncharacterized protein n=1 Tax=Portunus trituberculatus TaxID=210409 RepID=A0A5B7EYC8_PORTR|nr:hypothetical protein [Portunus trituberculatus]
MRVQCAIFFQQPETGVREPTLILVTPKFPTSAIPVMVPEHTLNSQTHPETERVNRLTQNPLPHLPYLPPKLSTTINTISTTTARPRRLYLAQPFLPHTTTPCLYYYHHHELHHYHQHHHNQPKLRPPSPALLPRAFIRHSLAASTALPPQPSRRPLPSPPITTIPTTSPTNISYHHSISSPKRLNHSSTFFLLLSSHRKLYRKPSVGVSISNHYPPSSPIIIIYNNVNYFLYGLHLTIYLSSPRTLTGKWITFPSTNHRHQLTLPHCPHHLYHHILPTTTTTITAVNRYTLPAPPIIHTITHLKATYPLSTLTIPVHLPRPSTRAPPQGVNHSIFNRLFINAQ